MYCHHLTASAIEIQHVTGLRHCYVLDCFYHNPGNLPVEPFSDMGYVTLLASSVCLSDGILSFKHGSLFCWRFSHTFIYLLLNKLCTYFCTCSNEYHQ